MSTSAVPPFEPLLVQLFDAFETAGVPTMPDGRSRAEVSALLTGVMRDPQLFTDYTRALTAERSRRGLEVRLLSLAGPNIPDESILRNGFASLPDEILADLALSPEALKALEDTFYGAGPNLLIGDWIEADVPDARGDPSVAVVHPPSATVLQHNTPANNWRHVGTAAALAACLLVGVFLGTKFAGRSERQEFALAAVDARGDVARGIDDVELLVKNGGDGRAFVTVVGLFPERRRPVVFNRTADAFLTAPANATTSVKNLPPEFEGATKLVVVLTGTPAGEAIRVSLPAAVDAGEAEAFAEGLGRSLEALNLRPELRVVTIAAGKK